MGILYGIDGANIAQCEELLQDVEFAHSLDDGTNTAFLEQFASKVTEYKPRLLLHSMSQ